MATRPIVPRADGEGSLGISAKRWGFVYADTIYAETINGAVSDLPDVSEYSQVTKLGTTQLKGLLIPVESTTDFRRPPLEVLKLRDDGISTTVTACEFNDGDASDFVPNDKVEFSGGTMHLKTTFEVAMSTPTEFSIGYLSESAEIDLSEYAVVSEVVVA